MVFCPPPRRLFRGAVVLALLGMGWMGVHAQNARGCESILDADRQNTLYVKKPDTAYMAAHNAACESWASYDAGQYRDKTTTQIIARASKFEAAATIAMPGGWDMAGSFTTPESSSFPTDASFNEAKTSIASYAASRCSSAGTSSPDAARKYFTPQVYASYAACLDSRDKNGIAAGVTLGPDSRSVTFDLRFTPKVTGATASFSGWKITPANSAECSTVASSQTTWTLEPQRVYNIYCELTDAAQADGGNTAISIFTSTGTSITQALYRPAVAYTENLASKVIGLQSEMGKMSKQITALQTQVVALQADVKSAKDTEAQAQIAALQTEVAAQKTEVAAQKAEVTALKTLLRPDTATGTISPNRVCTGTDGLCITNTAANQLLIRNRAGDATVMRASSTELDRMQFYFNPASPNPAGGYAFVNSESSGVFKTDTKTIVRMFPDRVCLGDGVCMQWQPSGSSPAVFNGALGFTNYATDRVMMRVFPNDGDRLQVYFDPAKPNADGGYALVNSNALGVGRMGDPAAYLGIGKVCMGTVCIWQESNLQITVSSWDNTRTLARFCGRDDCGDKVHMYFNSANPTRNGGYAYVNGDSVGVIRDGKTQRFLTVN